MIIPLALSFSLALSGCGKEQKVEAKSVDKSSSVTTIYNDVNSKTYGYSAINRMKKLGITEAMSSNKFYPESSIKRIDAVKMLVKARKINVEDKTFKDISVSDLSKKDRNYPYLKAAVNKGYVTLPKSKKFNPTARITRRDMAQWIVKSFGLKGSYPYSYKDVSKNDSGKAAISALAANEVDFGSGLYFKPNSPIKRVDFTIDIDRIINGTGLKSNYIKFIDNTSTKTYTFANGTIKSLEKKSNSGYPSISFNSSLNRQLYNLINSLLNKDMYTHVHYYTSSFTNGFIVDYSLSDAFSYAGNYAFSYDFMENKYGNFTVVNKKLSSKVMTKIELGELFDDPHKMIKGQFAEQKYKDAFKNSLIAVFGSKDGSSMFNTIFPQYVSYENNYTAGKHTLITKNVGNYRLDFYYDSKLWILVSKK